MLRKVPTIPFWLLAVGLVIAGACLLAAPVHEALMALGALPRHAQTSDLDRDFLRVFRRLLLFPMLAIFLARVRPWRGGAIARYGLEPTRARLGTAARMFGVVLLLLVGVLAWQMAVGWLTWEDPVRPGKLLGRLGTYLVGGLLAGLLEEWFFRGWLFDRATHDVGRRWAAPLVSLVYALVHAFRPSTLRAHVSHDAAGALEALGSWFGVLLDLESFGPAAVGLFCAGILLVAARLRTGTLWAGIGIHAAAVLVIFSYGGITERAPPRTWAGTRLLYDGPVVWLLTLAGAWWLWPRGRRESAAPEADAAG